VFYEPRDFSLEDFVAFMLTNQNCFLTVRWESSRNCRIRQMSVGRAKQ